MPRNRQCFKRPGFRFTLPGIVIGIGLCLAGSFTMKITSTDRFCSSCHSHPHVTDTWKQSTHYRNRSGITVRCVQCHLPPGGVRYVTEKTRLGLKDLWGEVFKNAGTIDWEGKSKLAHAVTYTYDASCTACHSELFSDSLSAKGTDAHVYYYHRKTEVRCINCHLHVGHYSTLADLDISQEKEEEILPVSQLPQRPASSDLFIDYAETIPGTDIMFEMVAIPGGRFTMGSPAFEQYRREDEGPAHEVEIRSFWMGRTEVTWREWDRFYRETGTRFKAISAADMAGLDAITGPTPPYGSPDQGWGRGSRPAITITHEAARQYCRWLSRVTGVTYRLPTEAEWEYAARSGTSGPYFFPGNPADYTRRRWINTIIGADTAVIQRFAWYDMNSGGRTHPAGMKRRNPFGLENMYGNIKEFCLDWYAADAYSRGTEQGTLLDPTGPAAGKEHVIRGGSYASDAADLRSAARDHTREEAWQLTDPQEPKSIWWYSDCFDVGFRIVREHHRNKRSDMQGSHNSNREVER